MSNITFPDKVEWDGTNPHPENMVLTPSEVNEIKEAINSKEDSENKVDNFLSPNHNDFPTTQAVVDYLDSEIGSSIFNISNIDGSEALNSFKQPGFYSPSVSWNAITNSSFPLGTSTPKGFMVIFNSMNHVIQRFMTVAPDNNTVSREFIRTYDNDYSAWGKWVELSGVNAIVQNLNSPNTYQTLSTQGILDYVDRENSFKLLGDISGIENLDTYTESGFYLPNTFSQQHISYPTNVEPPLLEVYTNGSVTVQTLFTLEATTKIIRRYNDGAVWSSWGVINIGGSGSGIQSVQSGTNVTVDNTDPLNPIINASFGSSPWGTPSVFVYNDANFSISAIIGSDIGGEFTLTRNNSSAATEVEIRVQPSTLYSDIVSAYIIPKDLGWFSKQFCTISVQNDEIKFRVGAPAAPSDAQKYFWGVILNR